MQHLSFLYTDTKELLSAQNKAQKSQYTAQLIQVFTSIAKKKKIQKILLHLQKIFPKAHIIGTTTAGEISHAKMFENETIISLSLFETTKLTVAYSKSITETSGKKLSKKLTTKNTKAAILLSEGLQGEDYEGFLRGFYEYNPNLIIAGGLAGDNFALKKTFIFHGTEILKRGTIAVSFSAKDLFADSQYNLNWVPIGKEFTITSSQGNSLYEIDNENAIDVFQKYLGNEIFENDITLLPDFQLLYKEDSVIVSRTPISIKNNAIVFASPLKEGQTVQFGFANTSSLISGSKKIVKKLSKQPAEAIFIYSCTARKDLLGQALEKEFSNFESVAPTSGFFTYGEYYKTDKTDVLFNCTTTILVLSESKKITKIKKNINIHQENTLDKITFRALSHFIEQTSVELSSNIKLLSQYKDVVDNSSLISKTDKKGFITYVNDNFCKVSGYTEKELIGRNHNIIRDKNNPDSLYKDLWDTIRKGKLWKGTLSNRAKDGSIYYVDATIMPIFNKEHVIQEYIAIRQDITKQIKSKNRIQEKEKLIKAIFDNQDSVVIHASKISGMKAVNKKLFELFDYESFEDFKNQNSCICDLFLEEEGYINKTKYPDWLDMIADDPSSDYKVKMKTKDGSIHTFTIVIKKIDMDYIINLYDITTLENALKKAHLSEQSKSIFLSNMSHEIRTPLNGILGFTDILSKKELDKDTKRYIDIIHKSGQTLLNVVNDILDFSKIESGELSLYETDSNLFEEMEAAVSTFASLSRTNHIEYYTYIEPNLPKILKCDIQRIKQVLNNLISNAMKFTPEAGSIKVSITLKEIKEDKALILFSVKDSGIGIAQEKISTIFNAFSQADNSISREFGGTGLGLAISNRYINMMGSNIEVKSTLGEGSEFFFSLELPIVDATKALELNSGFTTLNVSILYSKEEELCSINENIATYLSKWNCHYTEIYNLDEVNSETNIIIVCAKLFDKDRCEALLDHYPELQLLYIEGIEDNFSCSHKQFHLIEQPLTGSSIFDKLVTFSMQESSSQIDNKKSAQVKTPSFQGNILIAEDNETNQILISLMLEDRGINYKVVHNGQEALDEIKQHDIYDIIFMDINMPVLDGIQATKILRENNYTKPIVSLSANVIDTDIESFKEAGVDDTLNKPIVPQELDIILQHYLQRQIEITPNYDRIDIESLKNSLRIPSETIIFKLLNSFVSSATKMNEKLRGMNIDADIIHSLKGISGNLRFNNLYKLMIDFEKSMKDWDDAEYKKNTDLTRKHLEHLTEAISLLNK